MASGVLSIRLLHVKLSIIYNGWHNNIPSVFLVNTHSSSTYAVPPSRVPMS